jgi:hypothetical protein
MTVNEEMEFPDVIRIAAHERSTRETSLVVFYLRIRAEKKENPIFKIGIIPLDLDSIPETGPVRVSLYDQKCVPKHFLKQAATPTKKTLLRCRVTLPPMYFLPQCFQKVTRSIMLPQASSGQLLGQLISFITRCLQNLMEEIFIIMFDYLSRIEDADKIKARASWWRTYSARPGCSSRDLSTHGSR